MAKKLPPPNYSDDMALLDASELAHLLHRSIKSIKVDVTRRPETLPPVFRPEGTRLLTWRVKDVREWMEQVAVAAKQRHAARVAAASAVGEIAPFKPFKLRVRKNHGTDTAATGTVPPSPEPA